jgi:hypothetical protein
MTAGEMTPQDYDGERGDTMTQTDEQTDQKTDQRDETALLFDADDAQSFRQRWEKVQSRFVDDPRAAVQDADALVSDVTQSLTSRFAEQKSSLEQRWTQGDDVQTEDLRVTLQRYRALFERLLAA